MNSFQRHNTRRPTKALFAVTVLAAVVVSIDIFSGGAVRSFARTSVAAILQVTNSAQNRIFSSDIFSSRAALRNENEALREEVRALTTLKTENTVLRAENTALKGLITVASEYEGGISTRIISRATASPYGTVMLGAGSDDAVAVGDIVVAPGEVVIGIVADVDSSQSLVQLFFAPGVQTDVRVGEEAFVAEGRGSQNATIEVPRGISIVEGDPVYLAGSPFLLGYVEHAALKPVDAIYTIYIGMPFNISSLSFVRAVRR